MPVRLHAIALFVCVLLQPVFAAKEIPIYSYYTDPPFNANLSNNLTVRLANWLTEHSSGKYQFEAYSLPRKRLQNLLTKPDWHGVVAWPNPGWFVDTQQQFLWSQPVGEDVNLVISHKQKPLVYTGPASLTGKILGGVLGHRYVEFDALIASGAVKREDTSSTMRNLLKLKAGRVDVIFLPASSIADYRRTIPGLDEWMYISSVPRDTFKRYLFTSHSNVELMDYINQQIKAIRNDSHWQSIFQTFAEQLPDKDKLEKRSIKLQ